MKLGKLIKGHMVDMPLKGIDGSFLM
jgi:hypothetical protein